MGVNGIYGLSGSGLDIESMVKVGMLGKQNEYDKMAQKFTKNEWTKNALIDVYNNLNTFNMSTLSQYKLSVNMNARSATSTNDAIKVSANASAVNMTHKVEVDQLATGAYLISTNKLADGSGNSKLTDIIFNDEYFSKYKRDYAGGIRFDLSDGKNTKTVEITDDEIQNGANLYTLATKINGAGLNIRATYDSDNDVFSIYSNKTGEEDSLINIETDDPDAQNLLNALGFFQSKDGELYNGDGDLYGTTKTVEVTQLDDDGNPVLDDDGNEVTITQTVAVSALTIGDNSPVSVKGSDASIKIDGLSYTNSNNKFTVGGVTYDISNATAGASSASVTVAQDVDAIVDKVKSFVEDYNKLLSGFYEKYDEKPETGYSPLTQSQKDAMKDEQVEKWEEKAKKGLLYHDSTLGNIITKMRTALSTEVKGIDSVNVDGKEMTYNSIFSLGISTTGIKGQLTLDETKLRNALANDPNAVYNVFGKLDKNDESSGNGVAQRLGDIFTSSLKTIRSRAGTTTDISEDSELNNLLRNLQTKMSNFKKMMDAFEERLYKKYDSMESALAKLGSQLNYIMGGNS